MNISMSGSSFSGSSPLTGIELRLVPSCDFYGNTSSNGSISGSVSGSNFSATGTYFISETGRDADYVMQGTISGNTISGNFIERSGSFTLNRN